MQQDTVPSVLAHELMKMSLDSRSVSRGIPRKESPGIHWTFQIIRTQWIFCRNARTVSSPCSTKNASCLRYHAAVRKRISFGVLAASSPTLSSTMIVDPFPRLHLTRNLTLPQWYLRRVDMLNRLSTILSEGARVGQIQNMNWPLGSCSTDFD